MSTLNLTLNYLVKTMTSTLLTENCNRSAQTLSLTYLQKETTIISYSKIDAMYRNQILFE